MICRYIEYWPIETNENELTDSVAHRQGDNGRGRTIVGQSVFLAHILRSRPIYWCKLVSGKESDRFFFMKERWKPTLLHFTLSTSTRYPWKEKNTHIYYLINLCDIRIKSTYTKEPYAYFLKYASHFFGIMKVTITFEFYEFWQDWDHW